MNVPKEEHPHAKALTRYHALKTPKVAAQLKYPPHALTAAQMEHATTHRSNAPHHLQENVMRTTAVREPKLAAA